MNEQKRQAYLQAMDIQVYFPRLVLTGAKPSPEYDLPAIPPVELEELAPSAAPAPHSTPSTAGLDAIDELRSRPSAEKKVRETASPSKEEAPNQDDPVVDVEESLSFTLRYYPISEKLAVLSEVPIQGSRQLNADSAQLMRAILLALGQKEDDSEAKSEQFTWPLAQGYSMKNSPEVEAAKALSGFLQMRKETDGFSNLLVFAGQVEDILLPDGKENSDRDFQSSKAYNATVTHSLASMLAVPALKKDVWQHLQPLRQRIETEA